MTGPLHDREITAFICRDTHKKIFRPPAILSVLGQHENKRTPVKYIHIRKCTGANIDNVCKEIQKAEIMNNIDNNITADPNENYEKMITVIGNAMKKHIPDKRVKFNKHKHKKSQWITNGIIKSISYRDKLHLKLKLTPQGTDEYMNIKTNLGTYNKILNKSIREAKQLYYNSCFEKYKTDMRKTWQTINNIINKSKKKKDFPEAFKEDGRLITDKVEIANRFNIYYTNIGSNLAAKINVPKNKSFKDYLKNKHKMCFHFKAVQENEVDKIINTLKPKSSFGYDGISTKFVKGIKVAIISPLTMIINQMLKTGIFPDKLKIAKVLPFYKKGDETDFTNYRPVSLLPAISKIFEKAIYIQIYDYFQKHKLLYKHQYGFRKEHSTELAALELLDRLIECLDNGEIPVSIFLDLSKAFDTLDHSILIEKLKFYGLQNTELKLMTNYLTNRKQYVDIEGTKSEMLHIKTGVPQGSVLGPLLFIIYMNDVQYASNIFTPVIYADDTTLTNTLSAFNIARDNANASELNSELDKISLWLKLNKLSLNETKTKCMMFHMPQKKFTRPTLRINGVDIEQVKEFNFLGIVLNKNLNWRAHVDMIASKISRTIGILNRMKRFMPLNVLQTLYNTLIQSHINYGILTWGNNNGRIHKLQKKALRIITNSKYNAHSEPIFKRLKLLTVMDLLKLNQLKFYHKFLNDKLPHYFMQLQLNPNNDTHRHDTRINKNIHIVRANHKFAQLSLRYTLPGIINSLQPEISDKFLSHSIHGFAKYVKCKMIDMYQDSCTKRICYVCGRT